MTQPVDPSLIPPPPPGPAIRDGKALVRDVSTGRIMQAPPETAGQWLANGDSSGRQYQPVSEQEAQQHELQAYRSSLSQQALTAGEQFVAGTGDVIGGVLGGAQRAGSFLDEKLGTDGFFNPYWMAPPKAEEVLPQDYLQAVQERAQANPTTSGVARVAGQAAPIMLSGIGGLAGGAARGAVAGESVLSQMAARVAGQVATGAVEGGLQETLPKLANPDLDAQTLLADGALGAALGGGVGAVFGLGDAAVFGGGQLAGKALARGGRAIGAGAEGAGRLIGKGADLAEEGAAKLAKRAEGLATGETSEAARKVYNDVAGQMGVPRGLLEEVGPGGKSAAAAEDAAKNFEKIADDSAMRLQPKVTVLQEQVDDLVGIIRDRGGKADKLRSMTPEEITVDPARIGAADQLRADVAKEWRDLGAQFSGEARVAQAEEAIAAAKQAGAPRGDVAKLRREFQEIRSDVNGGTIGKIRRQFGEFQRSLDDYSVQGGDLFDRAEKLDMLKSRAQKLKIGWSRDMAASDVSGLERQQIGDFVRGFEATQEKLLLALEDKATFGDAWAKAQTGVNEALHGGGITSMKNLRKEFLMETGERSYVNGMPVMEADPAAFKTAFKRMGTAEGYRSSKVLGDYVENVQKVLDRIGDSYPLDEAGMQRLAAAKQTMLDVQNEVKGITRTSELKAMREALEEAQQKNEWLANVAPVIGAVAGGKAGAVAGTAVSAALRPAEMASLFNKVGSAMQGKANGFAQKVYSRLEKWGTGALKTTRKAGRATEEAGRSFAASASRKGEAVAAAAGKVRTSAKAVGASVSASRALWLGSDKSEGDAYLTRLGQLESFDPQTMADELHAAGVHPEIIQASVATAGRAQQYLRSVVPSYRSGGALRPGVKVAPGRMETRRFAEAWGAIADPSTVVDDLMNGTATALQVGAIRDVYPAVFFQMQKSAIDGLARADEEGRHISIAERSRLNVLLQLEGAGDPTLSDAFAQRMAGLLAQNQQAQPRPGSVQTRPRKSAAQEFFGT